MQFSSGIFSFFYRLYPLVSNFSYWIFASDALPFWICILYPGLIKLNSLVQLLSAVENRRGHWERYSWRRHRQCMNGRLEAGEGGPRRGFSCSWVETKVSQNCQSKSLFPYINKLSIDPKFLLSKKISKLTRQSLHTNYSSFCNCFFKSPILYLQELIIEVDCHLPRCMINCS